MQISKGSCTKQRGVASNVMLSVKKPDGKYYRCGLGNLYMSAKFAKLVIKHKVYAHGVTRKGGQGLPSCVLQEEVTNKTAQLGVRGAVKAAILCGDPECDGLLAVSVYGNKPLHFLATANDSIKCIEKTRE
eukprot:997438-Ditylum_brightwellii.AAC.3